MKTLILLLLLSTNLFAQEFELAFTTVTASNLQDGYGNPLNGMFCFGGICSTVTNGVMVPFKVTNSTYGTVTIGNPTGNIIFTMPDVGMGTISFNWDENIQPALVTSTGVGVPYN